MLSTKEKMFQLKQLRQECYQCQRCPLCNNDPPTDTKPHGPKVFGVGWVNAPIMLIGQNPGLNEVEQGRPFVGKAGTILDKALEQAKINRKRCYVFNSVLCYTIKNATPSEKAIDSCLYFLEKVINIIEPKIVVVMGGSACRSFRIQYSLNRVRNKKIMSSDLHPRTLVTVHPAYTIYNKEAMPMLVDSLHVAKSYS